MEIRNLLDQPREVLESFCESRAKATYLGDGTALCRVLGKYLMYVDAKDTSIAPHLMMDGYWESWITCALANLPENILCVDVGANHGYFTLLLADLCGEVVAFEPQRDLYDKICASVDSSGFRERVSVVRAAVGDKPGGVRIKPVPGEPLNRGSASVEEDMRGDISLVPLDNKVAMISDRPVGFVKIDAEGFEPKVWAGMRQIIQKDKPTILLEFTPDKYEDAGAFFDEIASCYTPRQVDTNGSIVAVKREEVLTKNDFTMLWLETE